MGKLKIKLPITMKQEKVLYVCPKQPERHSWLLPQIYPVTSEGFVEVINKTSSPVQVSKLEHFADVYLCMEVEINNSEPEAMVKKIYDLNRDDYSHQIPHTPSQEKSITEDHLNEISVDPDNILSDSWKQRFKNLCAEFSHIITPRPGKYNGFYGNIDNSINFSSTPPPSIRAHLPKYSYDMMKIMGEKMDKLEEWGVLVRPEDIGVTPEFILPSMLMPKSEKDEWRLVTDFTALNIHIKKLETVAPTIKEAKEKLAKYKYHIQLDLSNYYYQGGMKIEDCQYLATPHPFKGLRVYQCEPQGLKNAGEHTYERLALVYGDLCGEERMTRMADGLYILGDTLEELEENFREVLQRAELCGFTFKPSKVIITPKTTILFGWKKSEDGWMPTSHTISPLLKAPPPITVKQTRSWIGSYKQLTECIPHYAVLLGPLEDVVSSRSSAERVTWTEELLEAFDKCKKSLNDINTVHVPKPSDTLHTFSDFSKTAKAIGGRLEIHRIVDGKLKKLLGGHFSCRVPKLQQRWHPCEGEALAARVVLQHFSGYIRESKNQTIHHTDNQPVVQAWKRSKVGAFSASARISAFLSGVSTLNIEIIHTTGKDIKSSEYNSRNPEECVNKSCQICKFANILLNIGDKINKISTEDIESGRINMPFTQRQAWIKVQKNDKVHQELCKLIDSSQAPEKKRTNGDNTVLKRLHNLYKKGQLRQTSDGLITVQHMENDKTYQAISVPGSIFPGLVQALHLKLEHPSKLQLRKLLCRYFYSSGFDRIIEEITQNCLVCASLRSLPREIFSQSTTKTPVFAGNFSADVVVRHSQKILLTREKLSQFTITRFVKDEQAESLKTALLTFILEFMSRCTGRRCPWLASIEG